MIADDLWKNKMYIQRCDDTLSWATLALGSNSILGRWLRPCHVSYSWSRLRFVARKTTGSVLLRRSILIWRAVSVLLISLGGTSSYFQLFRSGSGYQPHSRKLFAPVHSLNWWRHCQKMLCCPRDNVWLLLLVLYFMTKKIALTLMSPLMLGFSVGVHRQYFWSGQEKCCRSVVLFGQSEIELG